MGAVWLAGERVFVRLSEDERELLVNLPALVAAVAADDDPAAARLHPNAYPDDDEASREFARLTDRDLDDARDQDGDAFGASIDAAASEGITFSAAEAWLRVLGDARLVLAAREGIDREGELPEPSLANPRLALVHYLGALQHEIVEVLMTTMAEET